MSLSHLRVVEDTPREPSETRAERAWQLTHCSIVLRRLALGDAVVLPRTRFEQLVGQTIADGHKVWPDEAAAYDTGSAELCDAIGRIRVG